MKRFILYACFLTLTACSVNKYKKFDYNNGPNPWINAFKDRVFFESLRVSYKNDIIFNLIEKKDAFNPYDGLGPEEVNKAKELAATLVKNMPPPVMCEGCTSGMNYYMANSLHYYCSRELDSIATKLYKKYMKEDKRIFGRSKVPL